jgi:hypothetical protein
MNIKEELYLVEKNIQAGCAQLEHRPDIPFNEYTL